jgi:hypothetical protein
VLIKGESNFIRATESSAAETAPGLEFEPYYAWPWVTLGHGLDIERPGGIWRIADALGVSPRRRRCHQKNRRKDESTGGESNDSMAGWKNRHKDLG